MVLTPVGEEKINSHYWVCMWMRIKSQSCPEALWESVLQATPACLCSVLLKWPTRECWEEVTLKPAVSAPVLSQTLAYCVVKAAKQAPSGNWGHCWPGTASELGACIGTLCLPSSCRSYRFTREMKQEQRRCISIHCAFLSLDQHSEQSQEVLEWDSSLWDWCCASTLYFVVPACVGPYQL